MYHNVSNREFLYGPTCTKVTKKNPKKKYAINMWKLLKPDLEHESIRILENIREYYCVPKLFKGIRTVLVGYWSQY